jgi:hypothetical protein
MVDRGGCGVTTPYRRSRLLAFGSAPYETGGN